MIVSGDRSASSAFLEGLQSEPAPNVTPLNGRNILQVSGLERAIASVDDGLRERARITSEPPALTDDVAAPATYRPYLPTPIPPHADETVVMAFPPLAALPSFPAPIVVLNRELFFHPPAPPARGLPQPRVWAAVALLAPLATLIAIVAFFGRTPAWEQPHVIKTRLAAPTPLPSLTATAPKLVHPLDEVMIVEVKQLKSAPASAKRHR